eukprot:CAMPEP_0119408766 /NCGR_PEP_ID=MMETSP1335-20130426/2224_1 /TAXON_ID=259385 /ORGANISM="Chrysoculter rhomboideus, Strain RCC1486" /LENGTH=31 /DNA_ID= /DNA_START= /DNA_END= /DNA_ORIENTATION=
MCAIDALTPTPSPCGALQVPGAHDEVRGGEE